MGATGIGVEVGTSACYAVVRTNISTLCGSQHARDQILHAVVRKNISTLYGSGFMQQRPARQDHAMISAIKDSELGRNKAHVRFELQG